MILQLKAKHFKNTYYQNIYNCAISKAAKEHFNVKEAIETVTHLSVYTAMEYPKFYKHKEYGPFTYLIDKLKAYFYRLFKLNNKIIREIKLIKY